MFFTSSLISTVYKWISFNVTEITLSQHLSNHSSYRNTSQSISAATKTLQLLNPILFPNCTMERCNLSPSLSSSFYLDTQPIALCGCADIQTTFEFPTSYFPKFRAGNVLEVHVWWVGGTEKIQNATCSNMISCALESTLQTAKKLVPSAVQLLL